jgi:hypothetical protein
MPITLKSKKSVFLGVYYSIVKIIADFPGMGMGLARGSFSLLKIITDQFINDGRE